MSDTVKYSMYHVSDGRAMWTVPRRYHEFYVLEQKLREFHGSKLALSLYFRAVYFILSELEKVIKAFIFFHISHSIEVPQQTR